MSTSARGHHKRLRVWATAVWMLALFGLALFARGAQGQTSPGGIAVGNAATIGPIELSPQPEIDAGFRLLYEVRFVEARALFQSWEKRHPEEALGPASEAASYLFEEFDRQGVLTSDFFMDDNRLLGGIQGPADPLVSKGFNDSVGRAKDLANTRLKANPQDADALFALTIATGMMADYTSFVEKRQIETLHLIRDAELTAKNLLVVSPGAADGYVALGIANYIMGCLPVYKRFLIRFGGFRGDRMLGMRQVALTASGGHYLRPYAKIELGLAAMRENQWDLARKEFDELVREFPSNPKYARELAKANSVIESGAKRK